MDQTGVGLDYLGLHHFGVVVDDLDAWTKHLEALGAPNITTLKDMPPNAHTEIKFRGPDNVVFDISPATWPGAAPVDPATTKQPGLEPAKQPTLPRTPPTPSGRAWRSDGRLDRLLGFRAFDLRQCAPSRCALSHDRA